MKTEHYQSFFYSFIFMTFLKDGMDYLEQTGLGKPVWLLSFFSDPIISDVLKLSIYLLGLSLTLLLTLNANILLRAFQIFLMLLFYSILYSNGKIPHSAHLWILSTLLMLFIQKRQSLLHNTNLFIIRLIQSIALSHYFISGSWKLKNIGNLFSFSFSEHTILEHIYYAIAEGNGPAAIIQNFLFIIDPIYLGLGFYLVIIFQLSCIIPIIKQRYFKYWGYCAILFHVSTGIFMGIWFQGTIAALVFFFIFTEHILSNTAASNQSL